MKIKKSIVLISLFFPVLVAAIIYAIIGGIWFFFGELTELIQDAYSAAKSYWTQTKRKD